MNDSTVQRANKNFVCTRTNVTLAGPSLLQINRLNLRAVYKSDTYTCFIGKVKTLHANRLWRVAFSSTYCCSPHLYLKHNCHCYILLVLLTNIRATEEIISAFHVRFRIDIESHQTPNTRQMSGDHDRLNK